MCATELLCLSDSYLRTNEARIVTVEDHNVVLDRTVFYPRGGGQLADRGAIVAFGKRLEVIAVEKRGDLVVHTLDRIAPPAGTRVTCELDWDFRYQMMRTHTALHVLCGVIYREYGARVTGCQMYVDRARMDFTLADLSAERLIAIESMANDAITAGYPVKVNWVPRAQADLMPELIRTRINLVPVQVDPIRTVDIVGLDVQADGGTHVANTLEIGYLHITRAENKGRDNRRIEIVLMPTVVN